MNVALPSLITNLHASLDEALWVVNSGPVLGGVLTTYLTWRWVFAINAEAQFIGVSTFLPRFKSRGGRGHIVNLSLIHI